MIEDTTGLVSTMHKSQSISKWRIVTRRIARAGDGDGQCPECERPRVSFWCQNCESLRLRAKFPFWTSGNENIDHFLQGTQFFAGRHVKYMEFIPFSSFKNVKYLSKGGSGTVHSATWIEGPRWKAAPVWERISGRYYKRCGSTPVALKTLKNSATMSSDFFQEVSTPQY
ncbi:hypothetical protein G9A89_007135 [Geosiphon pyriformis]|nr:hypothetical protein G9A89_007135 [Geosiphon pyriformis]